MAATGRRDINWGYDVLSEWTDGFASLLSVPSVPELIELFIFSATGALQEIWSDDARRIRDTVVAWCDAVPAPDTDSEHPVTALDHVT